VEGEEMKIGIIGTGSIANTLAETIVQMPEVELYAVASRDFNKAEKFAKEYGIQRAYGSYEELVEDDKVELVYIATPHSHHFQHMKLCVEHGKHVLCEKAFTINKKQAEEIFALAKENKVLVTEAIWTRYMPSRKMIDDVINSQVIGKVSMVTANLSYPICHKERIVKRELAGGALLDVGVYPINFALMHLGEDIDRIESSVVLTNQGVDATETITIIYKNGQIAALTAGIYGRSDRKGIFYGEKGYVIVENINNPQEIYVYDRDDVLIKKIPVPAQISGYEYEIRETIRAIEAGEAECASMPHKDTLKVMEIMDKLREEWGVVYPGE
jgi:predicted dehydrogenase